MLSNIEEKVLNIATEYLEDCLGYGVEIRLFNSNGNYRAGVEKIDDRYNMYINKNELKYSINRHTVEDDKEEVARDLVDTVLHECIHIICMEENQDSNDGDFYFEKMLYDRYVNSNFHRYTGNITMQQQTEGEKKNLEKLSNILNISIEEIYEYLDEIEDKFFGKYYKYINYVLDLNFEK